MSSSDCSYAEELHDLVPLQILQWFYILTSVVSVILVIYTARHSLQRTIFENVTKELIFALYFYIVIYSACLIVMQLAQLAYRYVASEKCDAQVPKTWCILRYILTVIVFAFVIVHIGITAQHALSSFYYGRKSQTLVARLSIVLSFLYPIIFAVMAYHKDTLDGRTAYCSGFTANSEGVLMVNLYIILILDILNALSSIFLWQYNSYKLRTEQSFHLSRSFHRRQNLYAMRQFMPVAFLHAFVFLVFFATVFFAQQIKSRMTPGWYIFTSAVSNVIPHYCLLCPLIFFILTRRDRVKRTSHVNNLLLSEKDPNEICTSILSVILVCYTARCSLQRTIFENVTKELIFALYFLILIYSVSLAILLLAQLGYRYAAREKCDAQVPKTWCIFRFIVTVVTFPFVIVHIGITAQHALASFHFGKTSQKIATRLSILVASVYPIVFGVMAYHKDSFEGRTPYCSGFTANSGSVLMANVNLMLVLDFLNAFASIFFWKYNIYKLRVEQSYNLALSFHRRQNLYAMRQFMPIATLHAVTYLVFFVTVTLSEKIKSSMSLGWYQFVSAVSNVIPHYCFLCPLMFLILIRRGRFERSSHVQNMLASERNPNETYFGALRDQWM